MAAVVSLCPSLTLKLSRNQNQAQPFASSPSKYSLSLLSHSFSSSLTLNSCKQQQPTLSFFVPKSTGTDTVEVESPVVDVESVAEQAKPKHEEVFAVVMIGGRQYIVHPGRYLYVQRLKGADANDKITLNKVLLVGTKTSTYVGYPIVPNTVVNAVVEEQKLDKKVIVFKYKRKKNYRRNIGHRQPITKIRITSITGYEGTPCIPNISS